MSSPVPRSGGTGSGTASTSAPCGNAGATTITATYKATQAATVTYANVNNHGATGNTVDVTISFTAANKTNPAVADFTPDDVQVFKVVTGGLMVVPGTPAQTSPFSVPNVQGNAVLQWKWSATDGSKWYDCAYITVLNAQGTTICDTDNGGCDANADCVFLGGTRRCICHTGFFGNGTVGNCNAGAGPVTVTLHVSTPSPPIQNQFTSNLASLLQQTRFRPTGSQQTWSEARINFITTESDNAGGSYLVFELLPDPKTGESALFAATRLQTYASTNDYLTGSTLGVPYQLVGAEVVSSDPPTSSSSSGGTSGGAIAADVIVPIVVIAAIVAGVVIYRRRQTTGGVAKPAKTVPGPPSTSFQRIATSTAPMVPARPAGQALPAGWAKFADDQGVPYYYNEGTGESRWDPPTN